VVPEDKGMITSGWQFFRVFAWRVLIGLGKKMAGFPNPKSFYGEPLERPKKGWVAWPKKPWKVGFIKVDWKELLKI